jgi:hypothetical protein
LTRLPTLIRFYNLIVSLFYYYPTILLLQEPNRARSSTAKTLVAMDFLHFDPKHRVLACTLCQFAVPRKFLVAHLRNHHYKQLKPEERLEYAGRFTALPIQDPQDVVHIQLPLHVLPIPYLALYNDGICCTLCTGKQPYVCHNEKVMTNHLNRVHKWKRKRG